jgi:hypothetical protein
MDGASVRKVVISRCRLFLRVQDVPSIVGIRSNDSSRSIASLRSSRLRQLKLGGDLAGFERSRNVDRFSENDG